MKVNKIFGLLSALLLITGLWSCDDEKELIIIEGNLPIKTSALYMVGDATPNGWSIDSPTPLAAEGEDPLVFEWEGSLSTGEMKLCLVAGSWDVPFIRPEVNGEEISSTDISEATFAMHAGDPDNKWKIAEAGVYHLTFDLRNWTMSTRYVGSAPAPVIEPIETEELYMVGDAAPCGWNIDSPTPLTKKSDYIFEYEGALPAGEIKCCLSAGSWDVNFIRPASEGVKIGKSGVETPEFVFTASPDNKWCVADGGTYRLTFDLEHWTISAEYTGELPEQEKNPIATQSLYIIGDATPGGWSLDAATAFSSTEDYIWTWEGELVSGTFKACTDKSSFDVPFIRPEKANVEVNSSGVAEPGFVMTTAPDDQWKVTESGKYRLTFNLRDWTIKAEYLSGTQGPSDNTPIEATALYIIGDATPGGWSMDNATALSSTEKYIWTWEGNLVNGTFKACTDKSSFDVPFIRPAKADVEVNSSGVAEPGFVMTTAPDDHWKVTESGKYRLTFDLSKRTISATYIGNSGTTTPGKEPFKASTLYIIGDATPGGWSMDNATALSLKDGCFVWEGTLGKGELKACIEPDGSFQCPFVRPTFNGCKISKSGVESAEFVYTTDPDDKWLVTDAGKYRLSFDIEAWTLTATFIE